MFLNNFRQLFAKQNISKIISIFLKSYNRTFLCNIPKNSAQMQNVFHSFQNFLLYEFLLQNLWNEKSAKYISSTKNFVNHTIFIQEKWRTGNDCNCKQIFYNKSAPNIFYKISIYKADSIPWILCFLQNIIFYNFSTRPIIH